MFSLFVSYSFLSLFVFLYAFVIFGGSPNYERWQRILQGFRRAACASARHNTSKGGDSKT